MKIANSDVYSSANYSYQKDLAATGAGTSGFFAGIVEKHIEKEKSDYAASGKVQTEDGRDIKVEVNVSMARKKERDTFIAMSLFRLRLAIWSCSSCSLPLASSSS